MQASRQERGINRHVKCSSLSSHGSMEIDARCGKKRRQNSLSSNGSGKMQGILDSFVVSV